MCGLFGEINLKGMGVHLPEAIHALEKIRHRGPDDEGWLLVNSRLRQVRVCSGPDTIPELRHPAISEANPTGFDLCLGFRRLSIVDLSPGGHQPMASRDGACWVAFNGEIYNYIELRQELKALGREFVSNSDTEVLLAAYQEWGTDFVRKLVGMFAFCLVDLGRSEILFARDPFGIKPLYYAFAGQSLVFGSEVRSLLAYPEVERKVHPEALFRYLRLGLIDGMEQTLIDGIREIPAGTLGVLRQGASVLEFQRYWSLNPDRSSDLSMDEAARTLGAMLEESVSIHLRSDVPLGTCLSGGLDSTALLMLMKRQLAPGHPIDCFSFITDDPVLSEQRYVDIASRKADVQLHQVVPTPQEFSDDLSDLIRTQEFPFGGPSVYAQYRVFRLARENGMTVMLDGQGADELFGGYFNFLGAKITSELSRMNLGNVLEILRSAPRNQRDYFFRMLIFAMGRLAPQSLRPLLRPLAGDPLFPAWLRKSWFRDHGAHGEERPCGNGRNALKAELAVAVQQGSLPQLLRYEDRNSMRFSIESRVPFCNHRLAELAFSLAPDLLISPQGTTKAVLRQAMRGIVPDAIIDREKVGFGTPERTWLSAIRGHVQGVIEAGEEMNLPFLANIRSETLAALDSPGRWPTHVWRIFNLIEWMQQFEIKYEY